MNARHIFHALAEGAVLAAWVVVAFVTHDALSRGDAPVATRSGEAQVAPAAGAASAPPATIAARARSAVG